MILPRYSKLIGFTCASLFIFIGTGGSSPIAHALPPGCVLSVNFNPASIAAGQSSLVSWSALPISIIPGTADINCTGGSSFNSNADSGSHNFINVPSAITCTMSADDLSGNLCQLSRTLTVAGGLGTITVSANPGIGWALAGPQNYTGSGNNSIAGAPFGSYTIGIIAWNSNVVTGINPAATQNLNSSLMFTVVSRAARLINGFSLSTANFRNGNMWNGSAISNDAADGGKPLDLYRTYTRASNGNMFNFPPTGMAQPSWQITDANGNAAFGNTFYCANFPPFDDSDYTDASWLQWNQGDETGDWSNTLTQRVWCGGNMQIISTDDSSAAVPSSWTVVGAHSTWAPAQPRVSAQAQPYGEEYVYRADQGIQTLTSVGAFPPGYSSYDIYIPSSGGPIPCSLPCSVNITGPDQGSFFSIVWHATGGPLPPPGPPLPPPSPLPPPPPPGPLPPTCTMSALPSIIYRYQQSTLIWSCAPNLSSCAIDNGVGSVPLVGNIQVSPSSRTTYMINCTGPVGATASAQVTVNTITRGEVIPR